MPNRYNSIINSRFRNCYKLLQITGSGEGPPIQVFYIDDPIKVGVVHGPDAWIAIAATCLQGTNIIKLLREHDIQQHPERRPLKRVKLLV